MKIIRDIQQVIQSKISKNKVIVLTGARRVGKTFVIKQIINELDEPHLFFNGEDFETQQLFASQTAEYYKQLMGSKNFLVIDEAQRITNIGNILKLIVDSIKGIKIIITGSSALDIYNLAGEPLTGRKFSYTLYPLSEHELTQTEKDITERNEKLRNRLIYGNYPELIHLKDRADKQEYLKDIVNSYLLKDILAFENIKNFGN